jgi:DNA modification methylase
VQKLAAGIKKLGFNVPVLVNSEGEILAGHGRVAAAIAANLATIPTICLDHLSAQAQRAFMLADNKLAGESTWDLDLLRDELIELNKLDLESGIDLLPFSGFDTGEVDLLIDGAPDEQKADPADEIPEPQEIVTSRRGDLWLLDNHRLYCGDSRDATSCNVLMGTAKAQMVWTDVPYNLRVKQIGGKGKIQHEEFVSASGEMSRAEYIDFLKTVFTHMATHSLGGSLHFVCIDWRHLLEMQTAGEATYTELKNVIVWVKRNAGMGSLYRSRHELLFLWKHGKAPHVNHIKLGAGGRYRTNCWEYPGVCGLSSRRREELSWHPTPKPVAMVADAIRDCSDRGAVILDPFVGSGTLFVAAERTGRIGYGIDAEPKYIDVSVRRWERDTGKTARLEATGQTFHEVTQERTANVGEGQLQ